VCILGRTGHRAADSRPFLAVRLETDFTGDDVYSAVLIAIAVIDLNQQLILNKITYPFL